MKVFFIIIFLYIALTWGIGIHTLIHLRRPKPDNIVYHSEFLTILGLALGFISLAIGFIITLFDSDAVTSALPVFCAISAVCSILIIIQKTFKITYCDDYFEYRNIFGITRRYSYNDIIGYRKNSSDDIIIYLKSGSVHIDMASVGQHKFLSFVKKQYRKIHIAEALPTAKPKLDLYNGNVTNLAGNYIFIFIAAVCAIAFIVMGIAFPISAQNKSPDDFNYSEVSFVRYELGDDDLYLYAKGYAYPYEISSYDEVLSNSEVQSLIQACGTGTRLTVGYKFVDNDEAPYYIVWSIADENGNALLSFDSVKAHFIDSQKTGSLVMFLAALFAVGCIALNIYVGRHPEKFPKKFVEAIFGRGQIKIRK